MNVKQINEILFSGNIDQNGVFPHVDTLKLSPIIFDFDFGLENLPEEPGIILIRGPRQYGKSTWLESQLRDSIIKYGKGSAFYLNGDELRSSNELIDSIRTLISLFLAEVKVKRVFIDEITSIEGWQKALKYLVDSGELHDILIVTTGSKATDLRRGIERLPGRKGRLKRTDYYFSPISFTEFNRKCRDSLGAKTLISYILSGGCPLVAVELFQTGIIPEFIFEMVRGWIYGECASNGRNRSSLIGIFDALFKFGGTPCGQAKIARESGLANNSVALGYLELLMDLMCISTTMSWDKERNIPVRRKPAKYHFINLLVALCWHHDHMVCVSDFEALDPSVQGIWFEWTVAQELWRRAAKKGNEFPELMMFWQSKNHEIDYVVDSMQFIEVKRGKSSPFDFTWFKTIFPEKKLTIINSERFETSFCDGITLEDFLLEKDNF
ncbi:MAG: AAA family ATPase [Chitinispirillia bacterium]|jgi:predicted AAA+ superfamily ATPase